MLIPKAVRAASGIALSMTLLHTASTMADELIIDIVGIERLGGTMMVAVFDSPKTWDAEKTPVESAKSSVTGPRMRFVFANMAPGTYAVKLYHDENDNGKLDTNMLGIPSEGYGFSNDKRMMGEPDFNQSMFVIDGETALQITLN